LPVVTAAAFHTSIDRLLRQVGHWEQARWARPPGRADAVYALVQRLADLAADAEQRRRRPVPRHGDLLLPDQLRVMADDLIGAGAPDDLLDAAARDVEATRHALERTVAG
jgi:hypothetical protein